jgi:hypothetical protein
MADRAYLVGALVSELPDPVVGSEQRWCSLCGATIWLSPDGLRFWEGSTPIPICIDCFGGLFAADPDVEVRNVPGSPRVSGPLWNALRARMARGPRDG